MKMIIEDDFFVFIFFNSVYVVIRVNRFGVIVCSLFNGVFVVIYLFLCISVKVIEIVEKVCEFFRG